MSTLKYFSCIVLLTISSRIYSQIPDTIWTKTFGGPLADVGNSVKQTKDGGFIVAATTSSFGAGGQDIYLIKTDENGDTLWTKTFGGTGNDRADNIVQTNDNGYAIFGSTNSYGSNYDFLLLKVDSVGNSEWYKTFNGGYIEYATDGLQTKDNGYIILGNGNYPNQHAWLIKTDSSGNEIWSKFIRDIGSNLPFWGYSVVQTTDSGYAVCGYSYYYNPWFDRHYSILIKFSSTGDSLFIKKYDFTTHEVSFVVRETYDGSLILGGTTRYYELERLLKVTPDGNIIWTKEISRSQSPAYLNSLEQDVDRGFIFSIIPNGNPPINPDFELIKCDINGDFLWNKRISGSQYDFARSVYVTNDSGYIVTGETKSFGAGDNDVWLLKFNYPPPPPITVVSPNGGEFWLVGSSQNILWISNEVDSVKIELSLDNGVGWYTIADSTPSDGEFEWIAEPPQTSRECKMRISDIKDSTIFDESDSTFVIDILPSVDDSSSSIPIEFALFQNYPNPFNPVTSIKYVVGSLQKVTLKVYDILGNEITTLVNEEKQPGTYEVEFSAKGGSASGGNAYNLPSGVYFYQLKAGNYIETKKMVLIK